MTRERLARHEDGVIQKLMELAELNCKNKTKEQMLDELDAAMKKERERRQS